MQDTQDIQDLQDIQVMRVTEGVVQVMEVQVGELAERMQVHSAALEAGKAVCTMAAHYRRCSLNIRLMDVLHLQLSL